jgi:hypothetical protein
MRVSDVDAEAQKLGAERKHYYFKIRVQRWEKFERVYRS